MERNSRKIKTIIGIINIFLSIGIIVFGYFYYQKYQTNIKKKEEITNEYRLLMNDNDIGDQEITDINNKIQELNDIDNSILTTRDNVFELAKQLETKIKNKETSYKIAYITFDDGPYYNTYKVLDTLKKNHVKATFFTTNTNGTKCYDNKNADCHLLYSAINKDHHTIANHTSSHAIWKGLYTSASSFINAVKKQETLIKDLTGVTTNIVRFPGGSSTPGKTKKNQMIAELRKINYGWVDWTAQDGDGGSLKNSTDAWNNFKGSINDNIEVILFHDYSTITLSILPKAIEYLRSKNYILLPLFYDSVMINK